MRLMLAGTELILGQFKVNLDRTWLAVSSLSVCWSHVVICFTGRVINYFANSNCVLRFNSKIHNHTVVFAFFSRYSLQYSLNTLKNIQEGC